MKYLVSSFLLLVLCSCSTGSSERIPNTLANPTENGFAIGTITFEGDVPINDIYRFFYEPVNTDKKTSKRNSGKIEIKARENNQSAFTGDFNNKKTYLFIIEREPGNYAFNQYNYLDHIGYTGMVNTSKKFSIPFEIKKGAITYIGELAYKDAAMPGEPRIFVADYFKRDIPEFNKLLPNIHWDKAINETVKSGDTNGGIIEFR